VNQLALLKANEEKGSKKEKKQFESLAKENEYDRFVVYFDR
jgi:hypothetical protein